MRRKDNDEEDAEEVGGNFFSPGVEKKQKPGQVVSFSGGWGGGSLFGNAIKLFENVGDVVSNVGDVVSTIVAPLPEDEDSMYREEYEDDDDDYEEGQGEGDEYTDDDGEMSEISNTSSVFLGSTEVKEIDIDEKQEISNKPPGGKIANPVPLLSLSSPSYDPKFSLSNSSQSPRSVGTESSLTSIALDSPLARTPPSTSAPETRKGFDFGELKSRISTIGVNGGEEEIISEVEVETDYSQSQPQKRVDSDTNGVIERGGGTRPSESTVTQNVETYGDGASPSIFFSNQELEKKVTEKYLNSIESKLYSLESTCREHELEKGQLRIELAQNKEDWAIERIRLNAKIAKSVEAEKANVAHSQMNMETKKYESNENTEVLQEKEQQILKLHGEISKVKGFLLDSENSLKEHEELVWKAKAEGSELLYALQGETKDLEKVVAERQALKEEMEVLKGENEALARRAKFLEEKGDKGNDDDVTGAIDNRVICDLENEKVAILNEELAELRKVNLELNQKLSLMMEAKTKESSLSNNDNDNDSDSVASASRGKVEELENLNKTLTDQITTLNAHADNLQDELTISRDELIIERNEKENSHAQADQVEIMQRQISEGQKQMTQLQVIISQLRQANKSKQEDAEIVLKERDELRSEVDALQHTSRQLKEVSHKAAREGENTASLSRKLAETEAREKEVVRKSTDLRDKHNVLERTNFELTMYSETLQSDNLLLKQESERHSQELENLHSALQQLEREKEHIRAKGGEDVVLRTKGLEQGHADKLESTQKMWQEKMTKKESELRHLMQRVEDESLLRRKAQLDLDAEKRGMQKTLENALQQLRNSQDNVVDRQLVANLIASYFKRGRDKDVMDLISKVLSFDDDQLVSVGLKVPSINPIGSFISKVGSIVRGSGEEQNSRHQTEVEGDNLADMWVNFLMAEAGVEEVDLEKPQPSAKIETGQQRRPPVPSIMLSPPPKQAPAATQQGHTFTLQPASPKFSSPHTK